MSENEMLNKKETLEEALGEEIEAVKGTVEEAAEAPAPPAPGGAPAGAGAWASPPAPTGPYRADKLPVP